MNVRKIIARLHAKGASMGTGGVGGLPEYTQADIAGALGFVKDKFAREVFCAIWWPEGGHLVPGWLQREIGDRQFAEIDRQNDALISARIELREAIAFAIPEPAMAAVKARLAEVTRRLWDARAAPLVGTIRTAVLIEATQPRTCRPCDGVGYHVKKNGIQICAKCSGTGMLPMKVGERAKMLGLTEKQYARHGVRAIYEWTYSLVQDAEQRGAGALVRALR